MQTQHDGKSTLIFFQYIVFLLILYLSTVQHSSYYYMFTVLYTSVIGLCVLPIDVVLKQVPTQGEVDKLIQDVGLS